jgi:hypothetical protein
MPGAVHLWSSPREEILKSELPLTVGFGMPFVLTGFGRLQAACVPRDT